MKRKSTKYDTPDSGGWMHVCDDLFLAQYRGRPCEVCGATKGFYNGKTIRSMGHHLLSKELHRKYRYDERNIVVLCPKHHLGAEMSPHSHDTAAQAVFYDWLRENCPKKYELFISRRGDKFNKEWCYREMYVELGGEINKYTKTKRVHYPSGARTVIAKQDSVQPMKYWRPWKHAAKVRIAEKTE